MLEIFSFKVIEVLHKVIVVVRFKRTSATGVIILEENQCKLEKDKQKCDLIPQLPCEELCPCL